VLAFDLRVIRLKRNGAFHKQQLLSGLAITLGLHSCFDACLRGISGINTHLLSSKYNDFFFSNANHS
jgi:hypothetical protein